MSKKLIVLMALFGLLALSGVAAAAESEDEPEASPDTEDTTFNFGYDEEAGVFVWGESASDGPYDCTLENGTLTATYTRVPESVLVDVDELAYESGDTVEFEPTPEEELGEEYEPAEESIEYTGADGECGVSGGEVAGPEGQVNHGMFLKLFNSVFEGPGRGCLVRHIAQSDLGKGDQQVRVEDVDPDAEQLDEGSIDFETVMADCERGRDEKVEGESKGAEMRPDHVADKIRGGDEDDGGRRGPPDHARGKADSAPGRNK